LSFIASSLLPRPYDKLDSTADSSPEGAVGNRRKEANQMDFVERLFGFSPDGGSGLYEVVLIALTTIAVAAGMLRRAKRRAHRNDL